MHALNTNTVQLLVAKEGTSTQTRYLIVTVVPVGWGGVIEDVFEGCQEAIFVLVQVDSHDCPTHLPNKALHSVTHFHAKYRVFKLASELLYIARPAVIGV